MTDRDIRVGDAERDQTVALLADHFAEGRLTRAEFDQRTSEALAARTRGELSLVLADLPAVAVQAPPPAVAVSNDVESQKAARVAHWRRASLAPWAIFALFFVLLWTFTGGAFWPIWPILGWGLGVALGGVKAYTEVEDPPTNEHPQLPGSPPAR